MEKNIVNEAVHKRVVETGCSDADVVSTLAEKECLERVALLDSSISKFKAEMLEAVRRTTALAPGLTRYNIMREGSRATTKFLTNFSEVIKGRQSEGKMVFEKHKEKSEISMEFELLAAVENAIAWLSQNKKAYAER